MSDIRTRAHIQLSSQNEVLTLVQELSRLNDNFSIENRTGKHRVNAQSVIGVMYTVLDFPDELFLVNDTHDGVIPSFVNQYRL